MEYLFSIFLITFFGFREWLHFREVERKDAMFKDLELKFASRTTSEYMRLKSTEAPVEEMDDVKEPEVYDLDEVSLNDLQDGALKDIKL